MDLRTDYLGIPLAHPFIVGASPLSDTVDAARRAEDGGAAAIVMRSLFEEQLIEEALATHHATAIHADSHGEASGYFADHDDSAIGSDRYLERLRRLKAALAIPVIASLNGVSEDGWPRMAKEIESAGADALELNLYDVAIDPDCSGYEIERRYLHIVASVAECLSIPLAVKLSPSFTSLPHFARSLERAGAAGAVLFNRFYEPDIDVEALDMVQRLPLSTSEDIYPRLRWLSVLSAQTGLSLAVTGGVHTWSDAAKAIMCGADAVQMVSALLRNGPAHLGRIRDELAAWMTEKEYESLGQMRGSMNLLKTPDPKALMRNNYRKAIQTWAD